MTRRTPIKIGYDLILFEKYGVKQELRIDVLSHLHWLVCGNSGSGKSFFMTFLLRNLLLEYTSSEIILYVLDFKGDELFIKTFQGYSQYYRGMDCENGLNDFYAEYQKVRDGNLKDGVIRLIFFDEWSSFFLALAQNDKKRAERYKSYLFEMECLGRSMLIGVMLSFQRIDAKYIDGRENFFVTICFGKMSRELKQMVMQGEDLEQRAIYNVGEGIVRTNDTGTHFLKVPKLRDVEKVCRQIRASLSLPDSTEGDEGQGK